ncbi:MAG: hypothetical protein IJC65_08250 [Oscillospiraceae bacterium]|nr:hypothetical protein [Oscillospiraceae bacterium]
MTRFRKRMAIVIAILLSVSLLCSCDASNDTGRGETMDIGSQEAGNYEYVSPSEILSSFDAVFECDYTKFTFPQQSSVQIPKPEGVYNLELQYTNGEASVDWYKAVAEKVPQSFGIFGEYEISVEDSEVSVTGNGINTDVYANSKVYTIWNCNDTIGNPNEFDSIEHVYINRLTDSEMPSGLTSGIELLESLSQKVCKLTNDSEDYAECYYAINYKREDIGWYRIDLQKSYKGVAIRNLVSGIGDGKGDNGNSVIVTVFNSYAIIREDGTPVVLSISPSFETVSAQPIEKMLSLKGACDLLEDKLAPELKLEINDIELMYEPIGVQSSSEDKSSLKVNCTPKWYFILDRPTESGYVMEYISVDCVTGEICVRIR